VGHDTERVNGRQFLTLRINTVLYRGRPPGGSHVKLEIYGLKVACSM
jgi:hypothetical protein